MPRWTDLAVTCLLVVCVAFLAELSEPLAAAAATAPLTSTASLIVWNKGKARNGATALELAKFALQLVKGTVSTCTFATTVYISASRFKLTLWPALAAGGSAWFLMWFSLFRVDWASQGLSGIKDDQPFVPIEDSDFHVP